MSIGLNLTFKPQRIFAANTTHLFHCLCFTFYSFFFKLSFRLICSFVLVSIKNKMNVHEFEKSLLERLEESCNVLQCKGSPVPASEVRDEWACHVELLIEPAGKICNNFALKLYLIQNFANFFNFHMKLLNG